MPMTQRPRHNRPQAGKGQHAGSRRAGEQPVRPARVRQASVTSATLTPAERASLGAIAAMNRAAGPPRAAKTRAAQTRAAPPRAGRSETSAGRPSLRRTTGIVLIAVGAILWLAVHATVAYIATQRAGLVLLITGLLWLLLPVPDKKKRLRRRLHQLMSFVEWDPAAAQGARCSLEDLLELRSGSAPDSPRQ